MGVCADQKRPRPMWNNINVIPSFVPQATHTTSRPNLADKLVSACRQVSAGRPFSASWKRHVARPFFRNNNTYFQNGYWPGFYDPIYMGGA